MSNPPTLTVNVRPWNIRIAEFIPVWMANRPNLQFFAKYLFTFAYLSDIATQSALEGIRAGFPGYDSRTDNFPLLGQSRGLLQGETETAVSFASRLRAWLQTAEDMGGDAGLAAYLHVWIGDNPMVRIWSRNGRCTTVSTTGVVSQVSMVAGGWTGPGPLSGLGLNWDSVSNPERAEWWWDSWIVIYSADFPSAGTIGARAGSSTIPANVTTGLGSQGIGHLCSRTQVDTILGIIKSWKGQHAILPWVIWAPVGSPLFDPANMTQAGNPDGCWGDWSFFGVDPGGSGVRANWPHLNPTCRYWGPQIGAYD